MNARTKPATFRQKRTRTLIQLGGLLDKVGLLKEFDIALGDDLQNMESIDNAATLLGFLKEKVDETPINPTDKNGWKTIGEAMLKARG